MSKENKFDMIKVITRDLQLDENGVRNTIKLLEEDCTIPFISRYRKELTGSLDENAVENISDKLAYYKELENRKATILKTIAEQEKLTPELEKKIIQCLDKTVLEDLYLPYKPKKRTKATIAREKGLEPLAIILWQQQEKITDKKKLVEKYLNPEHGIVTYEDALSGALDIVAEQIADNSVIRGWVREMVKQYGLLVSKVKKTWIGKPSKYQTYYDYSEPLVSIPSHRMLAIRRGAVEDVLTWKIEVDDAKIIDFIEREVIKNQQFCFMAELKEAARDGYKRLIFPSMETESFNLRMETNELDAIDVFSRNLKNLLLSPPAGSKMILGVDPGIRTGCKLAVIDANGNFKEYTNIYLSASAREKEEAAQKLAALIKKYNIDLIAIGNGTYSKETDSFVREVIDQHGFTATPVMVSEAGASVYSASKIAGKEFPELDLTIRGAISIARRLQDPLAELVKIDPKAIGVGQYQHDVNQKELKKSLDRVVESCVNFVGVELNTASPALLSYVSGLGATIAENVAQYRGKHGRFKNRSELLSVPKLGPKAFQQCAGFLRIRDSENPLDNSAIHPEVYPIVERMAADNGLPLEQIVGNKQLIAKIDKKKYVTPEFGLPTLTDILNELKKPGLDPRKEFQSLRFSSAINTIEDLSTEMVMEGIVTNVTNFGAFVDIGVHQDGLIHISRLSDSFVKNPHDVVAVGDRVQVKVLEVDTVLRRIALQRIVQ